MSHGSSWIQTSHNSKQHQTGHHLGEQKSAEKHQFRTFLAGEALFWGLELVFSACWSHEHLLVLVDLPASCREKKCGACFQTLEQSNYEQNHSQNILEVHWAKQNFQNFVS
jgi:hypothetical protein